MVSYVDDCLVFSKRKHDTDGLIQSFKEEFHLTDEGLIANYLGVKVIKHPNGTIELTQEGKIIEATGLTPDTPHTVFPATPGLPLGKHESANDHCN